MAPPFNCQSCRRTSDEAVLRYRKGEDFVKHDALLQCDVCERFACSECLEVYDILSGNDFLCHTCAPTFRHHPHVGSRGH
jgi:hypothetical protein